MKYEIIQCYCDAYVYSEKITNEYKALFNGDLIDKLYLEMFAFSEDNCIDYDDNELQEQFNRYEETYTTRSMILLFNTGHLVRLFNNNLHAGFESLDDYKHLTLKR